MNFEEIPTSIFWFLLILIVLMVGMTIAGKKMSKQEDDPEIQKFGKNLLRMTNVLWVLVVLTFLIKLIGFFLTGEFEWRNLD